MCLNSVTFIAFCSVLGYRTPFHVSLIGKWVAQAQAMFITAFSHTNVSLLTSSYESVFTLQSFFLTNWDDT